VLQDNGEVSVLRGERWCFRIAERWEFFIVERKALAMLQGMSARDRADIGIKQCDFTRIAREMSRR